jgi:hypothetical protein
MALANALAYYNNSTVMAVKCSGPWSLLVLSNWLFDVCQRQKLLASNSHLYYTWDLYYKTLWIRNVRIP